MLYASSVFDMNSAAAAAVCGLRRYTSVICLCLCFTVLRVIGPCLVLAADGEINTDDV